eukprot:UC4_evm1s797
MSTPTCTYFGGQDYDCTIGDSVHASSKEMCCNLCHTRQDFECLVGVYQPSSSTCYLKGGIVSKRGGPSKKEITSCVARSPPPPTPPYNCSQPNARCASRIGATIWNPCYYINKSLPVLLDGARTLSSMGSKVIKVALFSPKGNFPFNSPKWPNNTAFQNLLLMAQHEYYRSLWSMPEFTDYVLVAYSTVGGPAGGDIGYWKSGITPQQEAEETRQFYECSLFFLENYPNKTFVFENWEGDWASRNGYNPKIPATNISLESMRKWLAARQAGVTKARNEFVARGGTVGEEVGEGNVYFSAEVNLVQSSRSTGAPNMINKVIPFVSTDMVSYSSYDTQASSTNFRAALDFIRDSHNRTLASPKNAVFVAEYGVPENEESNSTLVGVVQNVIEESLTWGARYILFWEIFDNECTQGLGCSSNNRCYDPNNPVDDPKNLRGFWLQRPDSTYSWSYSYLKRKIAEG